MWRKTSALVGLLSMWTLGGCEPDSAEKIARLQEQLQSLTQQLSETRKQVDGLQEANQRAVKAMEDLETTLGRLNIAVPPPSSAPRTAAMLAKQATVATAAKESVASATAKNGEGAASLPGATSGKTAPKAIAEQDISPFAQPQQGRPTEVLVAKATPIEPRASDARPVQPVQAEGVPPPEELSSSVGKQLAVTGKRVSCSQVWRYLGRGKSVEATAHALGVSVSAIQTCEQKVGHSSAGR